MNCDDTVEYWGESLRSCFSTPESAQLAGHLRDCPRCRQAYEWDSAIIMTMLKQPEPERERGFTANVCKLIAEKELKDSFSPMDFWKSSADYILAAFAGSMLWVFYHADIARIIQSWDEELGRIFSGLRKVFSYPDGIDGIAYRVMEHTDRVPWVMIAGIVSLLILLSYITDLFADESR